MNRNEPIRSRKYVEWMFNQIAGLAGGLQLIHDSSKKITPEAAPTLEPGGSLEVKDRIRPVGTGYHHDLKPQNILHFTKLRSKITTPSPELGVYQIADFGVGKFHGFLPNSHDPSKGTQHPRGTPTYAAPESRIPSLDPDRPDTRVKLHLSRPYDVWSFGCVVMEMLVWLVLGRHEWQEFNKERYGRVQEGNDAEESDAFWIADENFKNAKVRVQVTDMLHTLRDSKRTKRSRSLALTIDLVDTILEVKPKDRISMAEVMEKLEEIVKQVEEDYDLDKDESPASTASSTPRVRIMEEHVEMPPTTSLDSSGRSSQTPSPTNGRQTPRRSSLKTSRASRSIPRESRPPIV